MLNRGSSVRGRAAEYVAMGPLARHRDITSGSPPFPGGKHRDALRMDHGRTIRSMRPGSNSSWPTATSCTAVAPGGHGGRGWRRFHPSTARCPLPRPRRSHPVPAGRPPDHCLRAREHLRRDARRVALQHAALNRTFATLEHLIANRIDPWLTTALDAPLGSIAEAGRPLRGLDGDP